MKTLNQLTQSHLCVLVLDKDSHNPIVRMPIYAELSIVEEAPSYKISGDDLGAIAENSDFFGSETVGAVLRSSLAQYIEESTFRGLDEERKQAFLKRVVNILENEEGLFSKSESEIKDVVDRAILKAMEKFEIPQSQTSSKKSIYSYPLGYLATDHVGYASFDLTRISDLTRSRNNSFAAFDRNRTQTSYAFFVYPMGKEGTRFDALEQGRFTIEAVFAKLSIEQPTLTRDLKILNLPSMQKPSLIDWYFSPGSFAAHPEFLVGDDGCERLFPAQIALQEFNIRQVVRIVGQSPIPVPEGFKLAYVDDYRVTWQSLGHSLGEILYSLPLAPGESVKLAVIDWSWESTTQRTEKTSLTEEILHQTHRDRTISETVKAGLREFQHGSSFMGGIAGSAGASGSTGVYGGAIGIAGSLGGSTATSEGSRDLVADNIQRLSDSFSQASSAQREINSTVVIQARQEEKESIQTRTFTNYNHSHTLTILYYEVLRHFKVVVEWVRRRYALLKASTLISFVDDDFIIKYRHLLEENLIDKKLSGGFEAIEKLSITKVDYVRNGIQLDQDSIITPFWEGDIIFKAFELGMQSSTAVKGVGQSDEKLECYLLTTSGGLIKLRTIQFNDDNVNRSKTLDYKDFYYRVFVKPELPLPNNGVPWKDIAGIEFTLKDNDELSLGRFSLNGIFDGGVKQLIKDVEGPLYLPFDGSTHASSEVIRPQVKLQDTVIIKPEKTLSKEEYYLREKLKSHFIEFNAYYSRLINLSKSSEQISIEFESLNWDQNSKLIDHVEPIPLEVFGSYVAYPLIDTDNQFPAIDVENLKKHAEKLITLPTRGVFAEGKLGHCNISEEIDNTRFWKWEEHPIPFEAPDINPVTPVTPQPQQTNATPTAFPSSLVNIVNPSAAPDPTGLAAALTVLGTPNIFRDMSGQQEVADLLKKLSDNTISIAEASNKATEIQKKYGSGGGDSAGNIFSNSGGAGKPGSGSGTSVNSPQQLTDWVNAIKNSGLSPDQKTKITEALVDNLSTGGGTKNALYNFHVTPSVPFVAQPSADTCWAAVATMLRSWKEGKALSITEVMDKAGPEFRALFDARNQGLPSDKMPVFFENLGMGVEPPANYTIDFYANLLKKYGPLWLTLDDDQTLGGFSPHAFIMVGIKGDGTPEKTQFILMEPTAAGEAEYPFTEFLQKFEEMAVQADPNKPLFLQIAYNLNTQSVGAPKPYDRNAVVAYAQTYSHRTCSDNYLFSQTDAHYFPDPGSASISNENDCTHFVSCCIGQPPKDSINQISGGGLFLDPAGFFKGKVPQPYGMTIPNLLLRYLKMTNKIKFMNNLGVLQDDLYYHVTADQASLTLPFTDPRGDIIFYAEQNQYLKPAEPIDFHHAAVIVSVDSATNSKNISCHTSNRFGKPINDVGLTYFVYARIVK